MKIVFLVSWFPPYVGGVPMRAYRIARGLSQRGHEITVHTAFHPKAPYVENIDGMKIERHQELSPLVAGFLKAPVVTMPGLLKLFSKKEVLEADVVQSFGLFGFVSLVAALLKLSRKKLFVILPIAPFHYRGLRVSFYRLTLGVGILRCADCVIAETQFERDEIIRWGIQSDRIQVIPNAIDSESYEQLPDPMIFRNKHGIDADEKIVLFVGRPTLWKGMDHLILAMQDVVTKIREVRLVVVCHFPRRMHELMRNVSSNVRDRTLITGPLMGESLVSAYSAADVFVLPSRMETFGIVALEAAAAGLPIVCTRTGAASDIVAEGKNGLFVEYGKVGQISDAIVKVLGNGDFKREAEGMRSSILKNYDVKTEIDQYEKIYMQLVRS